MKWFGDLVGGIVTPISNVFVADKELQKIKAKSRVDIAMAKSNRSVAKINAEAEKYKKSVELQAKQLQSGADIDQQLITMRRNSYLDEVVILVILSPAVLVFVPVVQPYIENGFEILQTLPDFYQALLVLVVVMTVGGVGLIRDLLGKFKK